MLFLVISPASLRFILYKKKFKSLCDEYRTKYILLLDCEGYFKKYHKPLLPLD